MNNDLISRSALKDEISSACYNCASRGGDDYNCKYHCPIYDFLKHIDNAPTVEQFDDIELQRAIGYAEGYSKGREERPQGEWTHHEEYTNNRTFYITECPFCKLRVQEETNFCPNCGADMKGSAE